jgi:translation initiation factor 2 alpha subunit (eIF-2alpha)
MAIEKAQNKMISKEEVKTKDYFFPDYGITVTATSQEEAEQKLSEIIKSKE